MHAKVFRTAHSRLIALLVWSVALTPMHVARAQRDSAATLTPLMSIQRSVIDRTRRGVAQVQTSRSTGSGFFVSLQGTVFLVTSRHVIEPAIEATGPQRNRQVDAIYLRTSFGEESRASVWKDSQNHDIAILRVENPPPSVQPLELRLTPPTLGEEVFVWGAPHSVALVPLDGSVLEIGTNRSPHTFNGRPVTTITARISVAPGNSGGPLLDRFGLVVGVISARTETEQRISTGLAIAIATSEFGRTIQSFNPREADALGFLGDAPRGNRNFESSPAPKPPRAVPPPERPATDFELAELQARNYDCAQRLLLPPNAGEITYALGVPGAPKLLHFPAQFDRILLSEFSWPQKLRLTFSASRDGGKTFVCVLP